MKPGGDAKVIVAGVGGFRVGVGVGVQERKSRAPGAATKRMAVAVIRISGCRRHYCIWVSSEWFVMRLDALVLRFAFDVWNKGEESKEEGWI